MEYRSLEGVSLPQLVEAWNAGFADYAVPMVMTGESMTRLLTARGYAAHISAGAFDDGRLVGFVLNGLRPWRGVLTGYDTGTALLPAYRGKGIAKATMALALDLLRTAGAEQYLLEVIQTNTPAVELYTKQGFHIVREFPCFQGPKPAFAASPWHFETVPVTAQLLAELGNLDALAPSWQYSDDTLLTRAEHDIAATLSDSRGLVACGIITRQGGGIARLAVREDCRRQGIGRALMAVLAHISECEKLIIINVDGGGQAGIAFLKALGFEDYISQYEMVLPL